MQPKPNYIAWTLVLAAGITLGNLATDAIRLATVGMMASGFLKSLPAVSENTPSAADKRRAYYREQQEKDRQQKQQLQKTQARQEQRANTARGKELRRICSEWRDNYNKNEVPTIRLNMEHHCDRYEKYIRTGST